MSHENSDFQTSCNLRFSALEPEPSSVFWLILLSLLHQAGQFRIQLIQPVFLANCGHLQALKVRDLMLMSESIARFKRPENQSEFKLKKNSGEGMKMFRKYQLAV